MFCLIPQQPSIYMRAIFYSVCIRVIPSNDGGRHMVEEKRTGTHERWWTFPRTTREEARSENKTSAACWVKSLLSLKIKTCRQYTGFSFLRSVNFRCLYNIKYFYFVELVGPSKCISKFTKYQKNTRFNHSDFNSHAVWVPAHYNFIPILFTNINTPGNHNTEGTLYSL